MYEGFSKFLNYLLNFRLLVAVKLGDSEVVSGQENTCIKGDGTPSEAMGKGGEVKRNLRSGLRGDAKKIKREREKIKRRPDTNRDKLPSALSL